MSGSPAKMTARDIEARALTQRAMDGELAHLGAYSVRDRQRQTLIALADILVQNTDVVPGESEVDVYGDFSLGVAVIDLEGNISAGGDDDAE